MEVLRNTRFKYDGYATAMETLLLAKEADPIMRDYAAQHLAIYLADRAETLPQGQLDQSLTALISVVDGEREAHQQVVGTILMALCDLNTKRPQLLESHRSVLTESVSSLLDQNRPVSLSNRISSIQAAGRLKLPELLPTVRAYVTGATANPSMKLSAIASLGYFAEPLDRPILEKLSTSQSRLRFAAQAALKNYSN